MKIDENVTYYFSRLVGDTHQSNKELWRRNVRSSNNLKSIVYFDISI